ncbi:DUF5597 domain-containing protein [Dyella sp. A6]|uniref:GH35 family beta-galactosidase n=1 Tax=Dyella aluminiiresistens TaxID=3069105 RepID=UPI002E76D498|nr:DUF5597 domain-containing protein [Dyella sp. A6]
MSGRIAWLARRAARILCVLLLGAGPAWAADAPIPRIVTHDGRHALLVDGKPFLILGAQVNNSSAWPAMLADVWPAIEQMHANTVEVPMAWGQVEPQEGHFDFSFLDTLLHQARAHHVRLVLLWFGTWKNTSPNYAPSWVKLDNRRFPRVITRDGRMLNVLSPYAKSTLDADRTAFVAFMTHLRKVDGARHTVIMVQVENESGMYGNDRDYSDAANHLFDGPVPAALLQALGKSPGNWTQVFGKDAAVDFSAWSISHYINQIAQAGKAVYDLPMYANAALRDPLKPGPPGSYPSGGPSDNVIPIWRATAPSLDLVAPDIYFPDYARYMAVLDHYARADNPLFVPETGNAAAYARYVYAVLGHGAIGFSPFGMDFTRYTNYPLGASAKDGAARVAPFAPSYRVLESVDRILAQASFDGRLWGASEPTATHEQTLDLGAWKVRLGYGQPQFGEVPPKGNPSPEGGALIARLAPNEYLVTGRNVRVSFEPGAGHKGIHFLYDHVEEGHYQHGHWVFRREWNGDQTDYGLNFTDQPTVLRVRLGTY